MTSYEYLVYVQFKNRGIFRALSNIIDGKFLPKDTC